MTKIIILGLLVLGAVYCSHETGNNESAIQATEAPRCSETVPIAIN